MEEKNEAPRVLITWMHGEKVEGSAKWHNRLCMEFRERPAGALGDPATG